MRVAVVDRPLEVAAELEGLYRLGAGAVVGFTGLVRGEGGGVQMLGVEHYERMTEPDMRRAALEACQRWSLLGVSLVHRVGEMAPGEVIVVVGTAAAHRGAAQRACEYLIDYLKTRAILWKREKRGGDWKWLEPAAADLEAWRRWDNH